MVLLQKENNVGVYQESKRNVFIITKMKSK